MVPKTLLPYGLFILMAGLFLPTTAQHYMERLNRGVVAVRTSEDHVFVSWRLLATDPENIAFNLYRESIKVNDEPITGGTNFVDTVVENHLYEIVPVIEGVEQSGTGVAQVWEETYHRIPLSDRPIPQSESFYSPNDASVADLDNDGEYEIVLKWNPQNAKDNSQAGNTDKVYLDGLEMDGTLLWRIDLGPNIRAGAHYTQFMVYDFESDGYPEVVCKTADGTVDGLGHVIGDPSANYTNSAGYVLSGPEFLTVFDGQSGANLATADYVPERGSVTSWGDDYGNRVDRFLAGVGYFDGERPSILMCRGYYTRSVLAAWDYRDGALTQRWVFDTNDGFPTYMDQGAHSLSIGDVDADGRDEVIYGAMAIDDDGSPLHNTQFNHGDATHLGDFIPSRPGLEFYMPSESAGSSADGVLNPGVYVRDANSGSIIWSISANGDIGRAMTADISNDHPGHEFWAAGGLGVYNAEGEVISSSFPPINFAIWWDADLLREMLDQTTISKWQEGTLLSPAGVASNNGTKATPCLSADLFGDWREEVIFREENNSALRIYTTTIPTDHRFYTLMHDRQYRLAIAWQNVGYNQPPHPSFYIGEGVTSAPETNLKYVAEGSKQNQYINLDQSDQLLGDIIEVFASSGLPVSISVISGGDLVHIEGSTITAVGAGTATLGVSQPGSDTYEAIDEEVTFSIIEVLGENESTGFNVYPNPTDGLVLISFPPGNRGASGKLLVYDQQGKKIQESIVSMGPEVRLDVSQLNSGVYLLEVQADQLTIRQKLIIR